MPLLRLSQLFVGVDEVVVPVVGVMSAHDASTLHLPPVFSRSLGGVDTTEDVDDVGSSGRRSERSVSSVTMLIRSSRLVASR
jgi:hypothetical protein